MKKRILIFSHAMELGGAERALLGLLEAIDTDRVEVDLFLMRHTGELMDCIPEKICLLPEIPQYACLAVPIGQVLRGGHFRVAYGRWQGKRKAAARTAELGLSEDNNIGIEYSHKYTERFMPKIPGEYDLAISFLTPHYFVASKVTAKKKIAWIHTDYATFAADTASELPMWSAYDHIISISEACTKSFLQSFPSLTNRIILMENIMPMIVLNNQVNEFDVSSEIPKGHINLLTIGRFSPQKNQDAIPAICRMLREKGLDVKWYLIGYGGMEALIRQRIVEEGMQEHVIILGKKENPYPYIKACDFYVQPSRYEGKCVAVREAQILHKPVIITRYATSASQLEDGVDGVIVPMDSVGCAEEIARVICEKSLQEKIVQGTKERDYTNECEVEKIYRMVE